MKLFILSAAFATSWAYALPWRLGMWKTRFANLAMFLIFAIFISYILLVSEPQF